MNTENNWNILNVEEVNMKKTTNKPVLSDDVDENAGNIHHGRTHNPLCFNHSLFIPIAIRWWFATVATVTYFG